MKNDDFEQLEKKAESRDERKRKEKEMKISGKNIFNLQQIIKERKDETKKDS